MSMTNKTHMNAIKLKSQFWIHDVLAPAFFLISVGMLVAVVVKIIVTSSVQPQQVAAKESVSILSLSRAPIFRADGRKFAVLGLGQDARSGNQIVWVKSISENKVAGFRVGDSLFGTAVTVAHISPNKVQINNLGVKIPVTLAQ